jgi:branched-chain amino acid transport system substrate-binding protein
MFKPALLTTLCGITLATVATSAATIGLMAQLSGPQALVGQDQVDGLATKARNNAHQTAEIPA